MTTTPLEQHRDANADASALAAVRERIEAGYGGQAEGDAKPRWVRKPGALSLFRPTAS